MPIFYIVSDFESAIDEYHVVKLERISSVILYLDVDKCDVRPHNPI